MRERLMPASMRDVGIIRSRILMASDAGARGLSVHGAN